MFKTAESRARTTGFVTDVEFTRGCALDKKRHLEVRKKKKYQEFQDM